MPPVRLAVEGCGHGTLNAIYSSVTTACKAKGWEGVDLLIIGGDFQSVRNSLDMNCMAVPPKYRELGDFHEYYSGKRKAPYTTIFVGGNHEASNYLFELHYGGWVAPNIYYMGASNVLRFDGLRIAGLSGIWKGYDYRQPHFERLPYSQDDIRSVFHVRELDTRKLLQVRTQVDVGISHDWPKGVEWLGDHKWLFRKKAHFLEDAQSGRLGSVAARQALDRLRPPYWFAAHLHVKYAATIEHASASNEEMPLHSNGLTDQVQADLPSNNEASRNDDEIDLDLDEAEPASNGSAQPTTAAVATDESSRSKAGGVDSDARAQLPASFAPKAASAATAMPKAPDPPADIPNTVTKFLALDKCLPQRDFLQLLEIESISDAPAGAGSLPGLAYDPEWLAITRVFASHLEVGNDKASIPTDAGRAHYQPLIQAEERWVQEHIVAKGKLTVPENFSLTAPVHDASMRSGPDEMPHELPNPQTAAFCEMLQIPNAFALSTAQLEARARLPVPASSSRGAPRGGRKPMQRGYRHGRGRTSRG